MKRAEDRTLSTSSLCSSQGSSGAASAAPEAFFQPKDLVWLDSCDKHRNEGRDERLLHSRIEANRDAVYGRHLGPSAPPRYLHGL
jgi:hypothetical protein